MTAVTHFFKYVLFIPYSDSTLLLVSPPHKIRRIKAPPAASPFPPGCLGNAASTRQSEGFLYAVVHSHHTRGDADITSNRLCCLHLAITVTQLFYT